MKKKGFTLIELLAVIVILSIIGIITIPLIGNVIEESRTKAALISTNGYIKAIENELIINSKQDGEYKIADLNVQINGEKAKYGYISIKDDEIIKAKFCIGKVSTEYDGKEVTISKNNYCSEDYEITLVVNGEKESKKIGTYNETKFTLSDISNMTNISCNNGSIPTIENNTLKVSSIYGNTTCVINSTLKQTIDKLDNTETYIVMLTDEEIFNTLIIQKDKNVILDLNGKKLSSSVETISNRGFLKIDSSTNNGIITTTGENTRVISSIGLGSKLILKNGYIKGTSNCNSWYCNALNIANSSNLEITPSSETTFENDLYKNGIYVETTNGIAVFVATNSNAIINGGIYKTIKKDEYTPWQHIVCSACETLTINEATTIGDGNAIRGQTSGEIIVNNGNYISNEQISVITDKNFTGSIDLNGGIFISKNNNAIIHNSGTININQTNKPIYISSLSQVWKPAILNSASGTINIVANQANDCTINSSDTTSGLCVYAEGNKAENSNTGNGAIQNSATGIINITGGTYYGFHQGINNNSSGIINVRDAQVISSNWAILNNGSGTINLCNSKINSLQYDIWLATVATGKINYSSNVIFTNGTNTPVISGNTNNIIPNYNGTCIE